MAKRGKDPQGAAAQRLSDLIKRDVLITDRKLLRVESEIKTGNVALAAFVGGLIAYIVWVLFHLTSKIIGALDSPGWLAALAQTSEAGEAVLAGVAVAAGAAAAAEVYKRVRTIEAQGIDPHPPEPADDD
ncbi:MAG: hypothetical protein ONB48_08100 [candidate division KSB1 bacterium]|nr:hypothetical protein [candidate division KSB1 bacterium]MDZ7274785.1 hypothetical protein [candidate division KSB1 bacterium]MDZ7285609.1 hypothetical protein [candidate division KSB1 bacterium]MDZ7298641.1 hypothetical protein [candidate division KSB1 bacterium]MDZ7307481.1 hypothetical protein [candidate division KSB1 bacterium]